MQLRRPVQRPTGRTPGRDGLPAELTTRSERTSNSSPTCRSERATACSGSSARTAVTCRSAREGVRRAQRRGGGADRGGRRVHLRRRWRVKPSHQPAAEDGRDAAAGRSANRSASAASRNSAAHGHAPSGAMTEGGSLKPGVRSRSGNTASYTVGVEREDAKAVVRGDETVRDQPARPVPTSSTTPSPRCMPIGVFIDREPCHSEASTVGDAFAPPEPLLEYEVHAGETSSNGVMRDRVHVLRVGSVASFVWDDVVARRRGSRFHTRIAGAGEHRRVLTYRGVGCGPSGSVRPRSRVTFSVFMSTLMT